MHFLEALLELSRKLPALSPVGRFCSRMRFAAAEGGQSPGAVLTTTEATFSSSYYRRCGSSRHSQNALSAHPAARPGETGDSEEDLEDLFFSQSRNVGVRPLSSGTHGRGRRATYDANRELSPVRRGSAATATSSMPLGAGGHRSSWSPVSSNGGHFGWLVDRKRARSEENGLSTGKCTLPSASPTPAESKTDPTTANAYERPLSRQLNQQRRSRGPSLPSVSFLVGGASDESPGQGAQGLTEGRWRSMVNSLAIAARDGTMAARERGKTPDFAEVKPELSKTEHRELNDGIAGWSLHETAETNDEARGLSEEELLGERLQ